MQPTTVATGTLIQTILGLPIFRSEWVLYLLLVLSIASIGVILERWVFYRRRAVDSVVVRETLTKHLQQGDFAAAAALLKKHDSLETNVVLVGLQAAELGPESVEDLLVGALGQEKARYERRLNFLATLASNAPYIGLFGTVLGIIRSFRDLAANMADASSAVMAGLAESLVATAMGLLVAIPAVIAYNVFRGRVKDAVTNCQTLGGVLLSRLKAGDLPAVGAEDTTVAGSNAGARA